MASNFKGDDMRTTLNLGIMRTIIYMFIGGTIISSCLPEPLDVKGVPVVKPQIVPGLLIVESRPGANAREFVTPGGARRFLGFL